MAYFKNWPILKNGLFHNFCRRHNYRKRDVFFFEKKTPQLLEMHYKKFDVGSAEPLLEIISRNRQKMAKYAFLEKPFLVNQINKLKKVTKNGHEKVYFFGTLNSATGAITCTSKGHVSWPSPKVTNGTKIKSRIPNW